MRRFTYHHTNKVDRKGRVSVPAPFRAALEAQGANTVYLTWNPDEGAIEGFGEAFMQDIEERIDAMPINDPERRKAERRYFSNVHGLPVDSDGRVILPKPLMERAGITDSATFVGLGRRFHVWEPSAFAASEGADGAGTEGVTLPRPPGGGGT